MSSSTSRFAFRLIIRFSLSGKLDFSCPAGRLVREVCLFGVFGVIIRDFCLESYANQLGSRALELFSTKSNTSSNFDTGGCAGAATQLCAEGRKPGFCPGKRDAHPRVSATGLIASLDPRPVDRRESSVASGIPRVGQPTRREAPPWKLEILERHWVALCALVAVPLLGTR